MKINRIKLEDFLVFKDSFSVDFCDGINVLIGANATGKSTLLKCIYAFCESSRPDISFPQILRLGNPAGYICIESGKHSVYCKESAGGIVTKSNTGWDELNIQSILVPTTEMLSHSKGLIAMSSKFNMPFDFTQLDILINAQKWETKKISERNQEILTMLGNAIEGKVLYENDTFYVEKSSGLKVEFSLEASGYKRLGLLWKLIRNGLLERDSILLWDEPENSLHPELLPLLVEVLYMLQEDGVQIFIATHSYTLAKYIDLKKKNADDVLFISLYKEEEVIKASVANRYSGLDINAIEKAGEELYAAVVEKVTEDK